MARRLRSKAPDLRGFLALVNFSGVESGYPAADGFAKRLNFKSAMNFRETIELHQPRLQQVSRSQ
jgi:hypothetical protein